MWHVSRRMLQGIKLNSINSRAIWQSAQQLQYSQATQSEQLQPYTKSEPTNIRESKLEDDWIPVTHPKTGLVQYWNRKTDDMTDWGDPRPQPGEKVKFMNKDRLKEDQKYVFGFLTAGYILVFGVICDLLRKFYLGLPVLFIPNFMPNERNPY